MTGERNFTSFKNFSAYTIEPYNTNYRKILSGVYNDFAKKAASEYRFELEPVSYEKFIQSIEKGLLECIILSESGIPTAFLVYTTLISEAVELNIIHCIGSIDINKKRSLLLEKFIELNKQTLRRKIAAYPMLGSQQEFAEDIKNFGFKTVDTAVLSFKFSDAAALNKLKEMNIDYSDRNYTVSNWKWMYKKQAAEIIHNSFKDSADALFDNRYCTLKGCTDIVSKITESIYGAFLPDISKVLLYKGRPAGIIFVNLTNNETANIPAAAVLKKHRNKGLSKLMLKNAMFDLVNKVIAAGSLLKEVNVSCDAACEPAYKMYLSAGFSQDYTYPTAYLPVSN